MSSSRVVSQGASGTARIRDSRGFSRSAALAALRERYPWPERPPAVSRVDWTLDGGGRRLITSVIARRDLSLILEIGSFLGGSARQWLEASPRVTVIAVDLWEGPAGDLARRNQRSAIAAQLDAEDGLYHTFLASNWLCRDRLIPVRRRSPEVFSELAELGIVPDLVYLDADKSGGEIEICHRLFPQAVICGDDWWWGEQHCWALDAGYPIREPVKRFCRQHGYFLKTDLHTWLIDDQPATWRDRLRCVSYILLTTRRCLRAAARQLRGRAPQ